MSAILRTYIEEIVGNTRCLVLSKAPQTSDRIGEFTETWDSGGNEGRR